MFDKKKLKGFINHNIKFIKKTKEFNFLFYSVLFKLDSKTSPQSRCRLFQKEFRQQLSRAMSLGCNNLAMTYVANCPPCGFKLSFRTRECRNPKICPWCFVRRRLMPAFNALSAVPDTVKSKSKLIAWQRILPYSEDALKLFSKNYGPHQMVKAHATVQAIVPFIDNGLKIKHVCVQIIDADCLHEEKLKKFALEFYVDPVINNKNIQKAINFGFRLPWENLFSAEQTSNFVKIMEDFNNRRLIRINKFKGESCGN